MVFKNYFNIKYSVAVKVQRGMSPICFNSAPVHSRTLLSFRVANAACFSKLGGVPTTIYCS